MSAKVYWLTRCIALVLISLKSKTNRAKKIPAMTKAKWVSHEPCTSQQV